MILKPSGRGHIITLGQDAAYITLEGLVLDGEGLPGGGEYAALKVEGDGRGPDGPAHHITLRSMVLENIPHDTCAQVTGSHHVWSHVRVRNCQGQESGTGSHGIYWQVRDGLIENIEVSQVSSLGIQLYYAKGSNRVVGNVVRNSIFRDAGRRGMYLAGDQNEIAHNVFYGNGRDGVIVSGDGNTLRNNVFADNSAADIDLRGGDNKLAQNHCAGHSSCVTSGDAGFVNARAGDFRWRASSPVHDHGPVLASVPTDFGGIPRPQGDGADLGAFEWHDGQVAPGPTPGPSPGRPLPAPTRLRLVGREGDRPR